MVALVLVLDLPAHLAFRIYLNFKISLLLFGPGQAQFHF